MRHHISISPPAPAVPAQPTPEQLAYALAEARREQADYQRHREHPQTTEPRDRHAEAYAAARQQPDETSDEHAERMLREEREYQRYQASWSPAGLEARRVARQVIEREAWLRINRDTLSDAMRLEYDRAVMTPAERATLSRGRRRAMARLDAADADIAAYVQTLGSVRLGRRTP